MFEELKEKKLECGSAQLNLFKMSVNGSAKYAANSFINFAGISPDTVALFVFIFVSANQTWAGLKCGISVFANGGTEMSSVFKGWYYSESLQTG